MLKLADILLYQFQLLKIRSIYLNFQSSIPSITFNQFSLAAWKYLYVSAFIAHSSMISSTSSSISFQLLKSRSCLAKWMLRYRFSDDQTVS